MYSEYDCKTFKVIGSGSQDWRAVSFLFTEDAVFWGMDSPHVQNYIFRWDRKTGQEEKVKAIDGPAYFSTELDNGTLVMGTTVEYGEGEWDKHARIWVKRYGQDNWESIAYFRRLPGVKTHGMLKFAHPNQSEYLYVSPFRTEGHYSLIKMRLYKK
jgi:hypothetical protein